MDLDLLETPGTKQVTKSKKRRSVRLRRKSQVFGLGPVCDEKNTDDTCPVKSYCEDVDFSVVEQVYEEKNCSTPHNQYGSVWMDTDSPEMAEFLIRRNRRKSRVHFPLVSVTDGSDSPVCGESDPNLDDHHLSMELSRTGDANNSPESANGLMGSYVLPQSPLVDTHETTGFGDVRVNPLQENDCSPAVNSFTEYLPSDNSTASLSPCYEANDYNIGKTFKSIPQHTQNLVDATKDLAYSQNDSSREIVLSHIENKIPAGSTQGLTSSMTPIDTSRNLSSDMTTTLTPYSPSQPIFKNISPPECGSPNSTLSPIYLTPACKVTKSQEDMDEDEDIWKTCQKAIIPEMNINVGQTPDTERKTKGLISTQKKFSQAGSKSKSVVPSKEQTSGFLSICRSLAGKLATAVRNSPDSDNRMSSSEDSFTSFKPVSVSGDAVTENSSVDNSSKGITDLMCGESDLHSLGEETNLSSTSSYDKKSGAETLLDSTSCVSISFPVRTIDKKDDGDDNSVYENITRENPLHTIGLNPVQETINMNCEKVTDTYDSYTNQPFCSLTPDRANTTVWRESNSRCDGDEVSHEQSASLQNGSPECGNEAIIQHLEVCFDYIDSKSELESDIKDITGLSSETGQHKPISVSVESTSPEVYSVMKISDPTDSTVASKLTSNKMRKDKTKNKRTGRKSIGLVRKESASCELSESVNKLSLNVGSDMDTCDISSKPKKCKSSKSDEGALLGVNKKKRQAQKTAGAKEQLQDVREKLSAENRSTSQQFETSLSSSIVNIKKQHSRKSVSNALIEESLVPREVVVSTSSAVKEKVFQLEFPNNTATAFKENAISVVNTLGEVIPSLSDELIPTCVESTTTSVSTAKRKGRTRKHVASGVISNEPNSCIENDSLPSIPSVNVAKKRGRSRKSMHFIPPTVVEGMDDHSSQETPSAEPQDTSVPQVWVNRTDYTDKQDNISERKQESVDNIKVLTTEDLKSLDEYLGIQEPEAVVIPPPKKRGRSRKSVDGRTQTKACVEPPTESADKQSGNILGNQEEDSTVMDVQTIVKDSLVAELEDLELMERPKRKSKRIQRRSIEIYRQVQTANSSEEDVPMSPLETVEESKPMTAVLQDVSSNHGNTRSNQEPKTKLVRKRKLANNEPSVEDFYRNKNFKRPAPKIWETIYEAPSDEQIYSKKRYRRSITFDESLMVPPAKTKMRLRKAVKNGLDPRQRRKKMLSDIVVKKKLAKIESILQDDD
ncbi:mucin-17-like [Ylistrum balloti]|uniref:mucin-17-like n=1 Tax=Ylistrum balloti TaxID=509963 RepID=UPI002905D809|nr:mucin-17-like [Ylistrum balloti]